MYTLKSENVRKGPGVSEEHGNLCNFCVGRKPFNEDMLPYEVSMHEFQYDGSTMCLKVRTYETRILPPPPVVVCDEGMGRPISKKERLSEANRLEKEKKAEEKRRHEQKAGSAALSRRKKLLASCGPSWYQEFSYGQMRHVEALGGALSADSEEGILARTKEVLSGLGIFPRPTGQKVRDAMCNAYSNPLRFLLYLYKSTRSTPDMVETNKERRRKLGKMFSINDRLILSAIAYLTLPITMHDIESWLPDLMWDGSETSSESEKSCLSSLSYESESSISVKPIVRNKTCFKSPYYAPQPFLTGPRASEVLEERAVMAHKRHLARRPKPTVNPECLEKKDAFTHPLLGFDPNKAFKAQGLPFDGVEFSRKKREFQEQLNAKRKEIKAREMLAKTPRFNKAVMTNVEVESELNKSTNTELTQETLDKPKRRSKKAKRRKFTFSGRGLPEAVKPEETVQKKPEQEFHLVPKKLVFVDRATSSGELDYLWRGPMQVSTSMGYLESVLPKDPEPNHETTSTEGLDMQLRVLEERIRNCIKFKVKEESEDETDSTKLEAEGAMDHLSSLVLAEMSPDSFIWEDFTKDVEAQTSEEFFLEQAVGDILNTLLEKNIPPNVQPESPFKDCSTQVSMHYFLGLEVRQILDHLLWETIPPQDEYDSVMMDVQLQTSHTDLKDQESVQLITTTKYVFELKPPPDEEQPTHVCTCMKENEFTRDRGESVGTTFISYLVGPKPDPPPKSPPPSAIQVKKRLQSIAFLDEQLTAGPQKPEETVQPEEKVPEKPVKQIPTLPDTYEEFWDQFYGKRPKVVVDSRSDNALQQIKALLVKLAREGNPLAALPDAHLLPQIRMWVLRQEGFHPSEATRIRWMTKSMALWEELSSNPRVLMPPGFGLPKSRLAQLTWNDLWFRRRVGKILSNYRSNLRRSQVEDAREYWPSMYNQIFDNKMFRSIYFTYLAPREEDLITIT